MKPHLGACLNQMVAIKHILQNHNQGKLHAICRNAAPPKLRFETCLSFWIMFFVHYVSFVFIMFGWFMFSFFYFEPLQDYAAKMMETTTTHEPEFQLQIQTIDACTRNHRVSIGKHKWWTARWAEKEHKID